MKITTQSQVPVYTISGDSSLRQIPEYLAKKKRRSDAGKIELLQDFEFEEASACVKISDDGDWMMSTGMSIAPFRLFLTPQVLTNLKYTSTTFPTYPFHSLDIHTLPTSSSSFSPPTTRNPFISRPTEPSNSTLHNNATTRHEYRGMGETFFTTKERQKH
jgi:hypothetical protein